MHGEKARLLIHQKRFQQAEAECRKALSENPLDAWMHNLLSMALLGQQQIPKAREEARRAIGIAPEYAFAYYVLSIVESQADRLGDAEKAVREALRLDPTSCVFYTRLANVKLQQSKWREAIQYAEQGLSHDPEDVDCINARAQALVRVGCCAEAEDSLNSALRLDPENSLTHSNIGWTLVRRGKINEGIDHFKEALRLDPDSPWAYEGVVEALKARNPIYHMMLLSSLSLSAMSQGMRRTLFWTCYMMPPLRAVLIVALLGTFITKTLFTLVLRLDPLGRRVLTDETKRLNNYSLGGVALIVGFVVWCVCFTGPHPQARSTATVAHRDSGAASQKTRDAAEFMADVQRKIKANWHPPEGRIADVVDVTFKVHADGTVSDIAFKHRSSDEDVNKSSVNAIKAAAPYCVPESLGDVVSIQFAFDYKKTN